MAIVCAVIALTTSLHAQSVADTTDEEDDSDEELFIASPFDTHFTIGVAFSVGAVSAQDVVSLINQELGEGTVSTFGFGGGAGFTSSFTWRALDFYDVSFSQAFLTRGYQFGDDYTGISSYSYDLNEFALFIHRVYLDDEYTFSYGVGGGLLLGSYHSSFQGTTQQYAGSVTGGMIGIEAILRTAFGGHLFLHTEGRAAMTFSGAMTDAFGNTRRINITGRDAGLKSMSGSLSVGLDFCF